MLLFQSFLFYFLKISSMNHAQKIARTPGFKLLLMTHRFLAYLSKKIAHGVVCIKNVDFQQNDLVEFTRGIYDKVVQLPSFLCFNNQPEKYKEIARVGNINLDGSIKDSQKQAAYWHQDGNFWGEGNNHIFNNLHTRQIPDIGGDTHVMDLVEGANFLRTKKPTLYNRLKELLGVLNIEDINDFKLYNAKNTMNIQSITKHNLVSNCKKTGQERLFLSVHRFIEKKNGQIPTDVKISEVLQILEKEMGYYAHKWEKGDLLIWDNLQVMHRSSGSFSGRRLLFRTQGFFD